MQEIRTKIKRLSFNEGVAVNPSTDEIIRVQQGIDTIINPEFYRALRRNAYSMGYRYEVSTHHTDVNDGEGYLVTENSINYYKDKETAEAVAKSASERAQFTITPKKLNRPRTKKTA